MADETPSSDPTDQRKVDKANRTQRDAERRKRIRRERPPLAVPNKRPDDPEKEIAAGDALANSDRSPIPAPSLDAALGQLLHAVEKHRLTFLYFAGAFRINPLIRGSHQESLADRYPPNAEIPTDAIDSEGDFLFKYRSVLDRAACAAISAFGSGDGSAPAIRGSDGKVVAVEGGSKPYWLVDETACIELEKSADWILAQVRQLMRLDAANRFRAIIRAANSVRHDEGKARWNPGIIKWAYLSRLDALIGQIKVADLGDLDVDEPNPPSGSASVDKSGTELAKLDELDSTDHQASDHPAANSAIPPTPASEPAEAATTAGAPSSSTAGAAAWATDASKLGMSPEQWRNVGLGILLMLAQAYYKMLECTFTAEWAALDLDLNHSYLWVTQSLTSVLKTHKCLTDFPETFTPYIPDLYPSTIKDLDWEDMVAPDAERFLSTVQQYAMAKHYHDPEEKSAEWLFLEWFRNGVTTAVERANSYAAKMRQYTPKILNRPRTDNRMNTSTNTTPTDTPAPQAKPPSREAPQKQATSTPAPGELPQLLEDGNQCLLLLNDMRRDYQVIVDISSRMEGGGGVEDWHYGSPTDESNAREATRRLKVNAATLRTPLNNLLTWGHQRGMEVSKDADAFDERSSSFNVDVCCVYEGEVRTIRDAILITIAKGEAGKEPLPVSDQDVAINTQDQGVPVNAGRGGSAVSVGELPNDGAAPATTRSPKRHRTGSDNGERPDGFYPPCKIVWRGAEHRCEVTKREMAFLELGLRNSEIDVNLLMNAKDGLVWKTRYINSKKNRDTVSKFLSRLGIRLAAARPPIGMSFSLLRGRDFIMRTDSIEVSADPSRTSRGQT